MGLRERKKALLRAQLYATAMDLFDEHGYEQTRIRDIVEAVGVSEATFFNYFPNKQALLDESSLEAKTFYNAYLQHLVARADDPAADRVRELVGVVASVFADQQLRMTSTVRLTTLFYGASGQIKELDLENFALLAEVFRQGQAAGEIDAERDPVQLAEVVSAVQMLTVTNWLTGWWGDVGPLEPRLAEAVDVVLTGCVVA